MNYVEAEGPTIDTAIERALRELGVGRDEAVVEILSNTSRGMFGIGGRKARVRASRRPGLTEEEAVDASAAATREDGPSPESDGEPPPHDPIETAPATAVPAPKRDLEDHASAAEAMESSRELLEGIVRRIGVKGGVRIVEPKTLEIVGDCGGILIGRRGQTLDALEYLVNRIAAHRDGRGERITVDTENYRERHERSLEAMAHRYAERARHRNRPVSLNPMSPRDRRIIHLTLQDDPELVTRSTGEGYYRRLIIAPAGRGTRGQESPRQRDPA